MRYESRDTLDLLGRLELHRFLRRRQPAHRVVCLDLANLRIQRRPEFVPCFVCEAAHLSAVIDLNRAIKLLILHAIHIPCLLRLELSVLLLDVSQPLQAHVGRSVLCNLLLEALRPVGPVRRRLIGLFRGNFDAGLDGYDLLLHVNDVLDALLL